MKRMMSGRTTFALALSALFAFPGQMWPQAAASTVSTAIIKGVAGGAAHELTGYALTSMGLSDSSPLAGEALTELAAINKDLQNINNSLNQIKTAIANQTCTEALDATDVSTAIDNITYVWGSGGGYNSLVSQAADGTPVTAGQIANLISEIEGPQSYNIAYQLTVLNTQMQGIDQMGIIGLCEQAFYDDLNNGTGGPLALSTKLGGDMEFYTPTDNLMQYLAGIQAEGTLLEAEYDNYEAFHASNYYIDPKKYPLAPGNAKAVCADQSSMTPDQASDCYDASQLTKQLYAFLQNQFTASGVPYTTYNYDGNGNPTTLKTGVWAGPPTTDPTQQKFYLFVTSLEDFTKAEDPDSGCEFPLQSTSATSPCGITASNTPEQDPFWSNLSRYGFVTGWKPGTAAMWSTVMTGFDNLGSNNSEAAGAWLQNGGFLDTATDTSTNTDVSKIIETQDYFQADPVEYDVHPLGDLASPQGAVCFLDTGLTRATSKEPICFNGSNGGSKEYGDGEPLLHHKSTFEGYGPVECTAFSAETGLLGETGDQSFYQGVVRSHYYEYDNQFEKSTDCPGPKSGDPAYWYNGMLPGWTWDGGSAATNHKTFFWPAVDVSDGSASCAGTNYSWGDVQTSVSREPVNFLDIPTMCSKDFDRYFAAIVDPVNAFQQFVFTTPPVSGAGGADATLGPITIQMQSTYGSTKPLTFSTDTLVTLDSTSTGTAVFALTPGGSQITSVTIPAGQSSATFYYGDSAEGTPVIGASTGTITSAYEVANILSNFPTPSLVGRVNYGATGKDNGSFRLRGKLQLPKGIRLNQVVLTIGHVLHDDGGAGELILGSGSSRLTFPLTLTPAKGSTPTHAIFETRPGVEPYLTVEVTARHKGHILYRNNNPGLSGFDITLLHANIGTPKACTGASSQVMLRTQLSLSDGSHPPTSFDSQIDWQCMAHGLITPTDSARNFVDKASLR